MIISEITDTDIIAVSDILISAYKDEPWDENEVGCSEDEASELLESRDIYQRELNEDIQSKLDEIKRVHDSFLEHNYQIAHVLLNTGTREDLVAQMNNLINYYIR